MPTPIASKPEALPCRWSNRVPLHSYGVARLEFALTVVVVGALAAFALQRLPSLQTAAAAAKDESAAAQARSASALLQARCAGMSGVAALPSASAPGPTATPPTKSSPVSCP